MWARFRASRAGCSSSYSACSRLCDGLQPNAVCLPLRAKTRRLPSEPRPTLLKVVQSRGLQHGGGASAFPSPNPSSRFPQTASLIARVAAKNIAQCALIRKYANTVTPFLRCIDWMIRFFYLRVQTGTCRASIFPHFLHTC